eukprot:4344387-Prymnesium_polylepis.2
MAAGRWQQQDPGTPINTKTRARTWPTTFLRVKEAAQEGTTDMHSLQYTPSRAAHLQYGLD